VAPLAGVAAEFGVVMLLSLLVIPAAYRLMRSKL